jgi:tripartite-type tricarboxylate transporter receptor subunit TctC
VKLPRRKFLHLVAGAAALPVLPSLAGAQAYPTRPVRLVLSTTPGGPADVVARIMGQWLSERLGQPFVIENRPGAGSNIGTEAVVRAPADGYTLLLVAAGNASNATLYHKLNFNFIRDIVSVASLIRGPFVMVVNASFPAKTIPEFIAYAEANPGKISFASGGTGYAAHLSGELFKMMTGVNMIHVPYRGQAPAMTDLLGGQVQVMFDSVVSSLPHIRTGKLRPRRRARRRCQISRLWAILWLGMRRACGSASVRPGTRLPRSSTDSTRRSMRASPIQRSSHGSASWVVPRFRALQRISANSSSRKLRSGPR